MFVAAVHLHQHHAADRRAADMGLSVLGRKHRSAEDRTLGVQDTGSATEYSFYQSELKSSVYAGGEAHESE